MHFYKNLLLMIYKLLVHMYPKFVILLFFLLFYN